MNILCSFFVQNNAFDWSVLAIQAHTSLLYPKYHELLIETLQSKIFIPDIHSDFVAVTSPSYPCQHCEDIRIHIMNTSCSFCVKIITSPFQICFQSFSTCVLCENVRKIWQAHRLPNRCNRKFLFLHTTAKCRILWAKDRFSFLNNAGILLPVDLISLQIMIFWVKVYIVN